MAGGRICAPILIHSIDSEIIIGAGGFAEIRKVIVNIVKRLESENPELRNANSNTAQQRTVKMSLVRKVAAKEKLFFEKQIIFHIGKGSCIFINKYFDPKLDPEAVGIDKSAFEDSLFTEFCQEKSLNYYLAKMSSILSIKYKIFLLYQVVIGLRFLRDYGVVHLDIKPENILVKMGSDSSNVFALAKIIDFGEAYCETSISKSNG